MEAKRSNQLDQSPVPALRLHTSQSHRPASSVQFSLSHDMLKTTLRASTSHNLHDLMHTRDRSNSPIVQQSTPDLYTLRARTPAISTLTARENARLEQRLNVGNAGPSRPIERARTARLVGSVPGDADFKRILDKLNRITSRGGAQDKRLALEEGKAVHAVLEEDEWVYAKVSVKGLRTPMQLNIKRQQGKLHTFLSKTAQEPSEALCDAKFKGDKVMATDIGLRFKCNSLYIGFHAIESAAFSVTVSFGKQRKTAKSNFRAVQVTSEDLDLTFLHTRKVDFTHKKDFLSANMRVSASTERFTQLAKQRSLSEKRQKEAEERRLEYQKMKKTLALLAIHRMEIKKQEKLELEKVREMREFQQSIEKAWILLLYSARITESLELLLAKRKAEIAYAEWRNGLVVKIQRRIRRYHCHQTTTMLAMATAAHHYHLITTCLTALDLDLVQKNILNCLKVSGLRVKLTSHVASFYNHSKSYLVICLQRGWRAAISLKKDRFTRLNGIWTQAFGLILEEVCKRKPSKKAKKTKENPTTAYFAITPFRKSQLLMQHYLEAKQRFLLDLKAFSISKRTGGKPIPPNFDYAPSVKEMMQIVERAVSYNL